MEKQQKSFPSITMISLFTEYLSHALAPTSDPAPAPVHLCDKQPAVVVSATNVSCRYTLARIAYHLCSMAE